MPESAAGGGEEEEGEEEGEEEEGRWDSQVPKPVNFVGPISDIVKKLPEGMQIVRIENILRPDLARRFERACQQASHSLWRKERQQPHKFSLKPQIAFHGTLQRSLPSIVHRGLLIPDKNIVKIRCGSTHGVGIYLSPSAEFSLGYSDTDRLIVCAALLGRVFKGDQESVRGHTSPFFTFVSPSEMEWVFFNAAQVLPCYVIQVEIKKVRQKVYNPPPLSSLLSSQHEEDDGKKERDAKLLARARKFLPYGYGPGSKTVILDAASFDDDEEDYGDYQEFRHAGKEEDSVRYSGVVKEATKLQKYRFRDPYARTNSMENEQS